MNLDTLDERQATERAEQHIADAVAAVRAVVGQLRLELASELRTDCDDPSDFGPKGRIQVSRRYWLVGVRGAAAFDAVRAHWLSSGYRILEDAADRAVEDMKTGEVRPAPMLWVEHDRDGFRLNLVSSARGDLSLVATSPCIWPSGSPVDS